MNRRDTRGYPKPSPRRVAGAPSYEYPTLPTQSRSGAFPCEEAYSSGVDAIKNDGRNSYCGGTMQQGSSTSFSPISSGSGGSGLVSASSGLGSRKSSAHSVQNISDPPSDDSDDDIGPPEAKKGQGFRERRREAHTQAEQKRRDAIKVRSSCNSCRFSIEESCVDVLSAGEGMFSNNVTLDFFFSVNEGSLMGFKEVSLHGDWCSPCSVA